MDDFRHANSISIFTRFFFIFMTMCGTASQRESENRADVSAAASRGRADVTFKNSRTGWREQPRPRPLSLSLSFFYPYGLPPRITLLLIGLYCHNLSFGLRRGSDPALYRHGNGIPCRKVRKRIPYIRLPLILDPDPGQNGGVPTILARIRNAHTHAPSGRLQNG